MTTKSWSLLALFLILLGLALYLLFVVRATEGDPWRDVSVAGYVTVGCATAAVLALGIGALLLHRRRRR